MNFLTRSPSKSVYGERSSVTEHRVDAHQRSASGSSLETFVSQDSYVRYDDSSVGGVNSKYDLRVVVDQYLDVSEEEGWITIPYKDLPENWNHVSDIQSLRSLDRPFLFPGEQVHILACLSACKQDTHITTSSDFAAAISKNGIGHYLEKENGNIVHRNNSVSKEGELSTSGEKQLVNVSNSESLLSEDVHKTQTALLLHKFKNSHFFVRISEFDEPLWSKRGSSEKLSNSHKAKDLKPSSIKIEETALSSTGALIDRGSFNATISSGVARNSIKCCALPNGDVVVLLQVNVGVNFLKDPCIEILQFEKCAESILSPDNQVNAVPTNQDPCAELLNWMLPLDNTLPPRRSYSMSSLPQSTSTPTAHIKVSSSESNFDFENWDQISSYRFLRKKPGMQGVVSFRGVLLEREIFSVCGGLQGIYTPGRRWRRKLEIIQPVEIHSFAADCNSEDLLCVQIKNVAPAHAPDIVIFIDAITIILEESTKNGPTSSLPISFIEAGNDHTLPNLALRRGEEHSFVLKPRTSAWKSLNMRNNMSSQLSMLQFGNKTSQLSLDKRKLALMNDQYAIMVSCRCNYTASRLFIKQPISWQPHTSRDIMISVASKMLGRSPGPYGTLQLPVQILSLQVSNLTTEDLTLTMLAPASFTSLPSVVSVNSPRTPKSPFIGFSEVLGRIHGERVTGTALGQSFSCIVEENEKQSCGGKAQETSMADDVIPCSSLSCTHLWLQSEVPLGCIPSQSIATIKLELLPLADGIITLDSLQIYAKEKGVTYTPKHSLKINATSSISKGVI